MKTTNLLRNLTVSLNIALLLLANGCGLKGDLYIPEKETASTSPLAESDDDGEAESKTQAD